MKIQCITMQIARATQNARTADSKNEKNNWEFHAQQLRKLLKNLGAEPGRPRRRKR